MNEFMTFMLMQLLEKKMEKKDKGKTMEEYLTDVFGSK